MLSTCRTQPLYRELYKGWDIYKIGVGGNKKQIGNDQEREDNIPDKNM